MLPKERMLIEADSFTPANTPADAPAGLPNLAHFLDAVTRPILRPVQKIIPPLGGVDISPIIVLLVIQAFRQYLLPQMLLLG